MTSSFQGGFQGGVSLEEDPIHVILEGLVAQAALGSVSFIDKLGVFQNELLQGI